MLSEEERSVVELAIDLLATGECKPTGALVAAHNRLGLTGFPDDICAHEDLINGWMTAKTADERVLRLRKLLAADDAEKSSHMKATR